jgi:hypothetical protein
MFKNMNESFNSIHELLNDMYMKNKDITIPSFISNISGMKSNISNIQNDEIENHKTMPTKSENSNKSIEKKVFFIEKGKKETENKKEEFVKKIKIIMMQNIINLLMII